MAQVKNLPAMWETWVLSLGWEDSLEKGMATHSSTFAWRIPWTVGAWRATVHRVSDFHFHFSLPTELSEKEKKVYILHFNNYH